MDYNERENTVGNVVAGATETYSRTKALQKTSQSVFSRFIKMPYHLMDTAIVYKFAKIKIRNEIVKQYLLYTSIITIVLGICIVITKDIGIAIGLLLGNIANYFILVHTKKGE